MSGIYIIGFDIYPGVYKIGKSKDIDSRYKQFKQNTSILGNVKLIYSKEFEDYSKAESDIHSTLKEYRVQENREFFKGNVEEFIKIIENLNPKDYKILNTAQSTEINKESEKEESYKPNFKEIADTLPDVIDVRIPNYTKHILHLLEEINLIGNNTQKLLEITNGLTNIVNTLMKENVYLLAITKQHAEEIAKLKQQKAAENIIL